MATATGENQEAPAAPAKPRVCGTCGAAARYTCPGCGVRTCSLPCVQAHKEASGCTGVRDRTKLVFKEDMDNLTLLSDYRFLEEVDNLLEDNTRHQLHRMAKRRRPDERPSLPPHLQRLQAQAAQRGTTLKFMPVFFSNHRHNSTRYQFKEGIIRWHIKWIFHQAEVVLTDSSVDENTSIFRVLAKYMNPVENKLSAEDKEKLAFYHSASYSRVSVLIKTETADKRVIFQELEPYKSLRVNFANKVITEYPVLYVVLKDHLESYLEYESEGHDDLFSEVEVKEEQKKDELKFFEADSDEDDNDESE